jgi:uncharacterized protein (TIGR00296 family)
MLSKQQGEQIVKHARNIIINHVIKNNLPEIPDETIYRNKSGVFVTIHTYPSHLLRGCIGIPEPVMSLGNAVIDAAISVTHDPRFPPLSSDELENIIIEVTVLSPPKIIMVEKPIDYTNGIIIGRDGLIVEQGLRKGLLLPQVPVEQGWDVEEFLSNTCMKAGLMPDAWLDKTTKIYKFQGQIFSELKPNGEIEEKQINET